MPFVKLDCGMLDSTIWIDRVAREVFLTALLMAVPWEQKEAEEALKVASIEPSGFVVPPGWYGKVNAAGPGILRRGGIDFEEGMAALGRLSDPEVGSRSSEWDGRRMVRVNGGYLILNYDKYRQRDYTARERMKRFRDKAKRGKPVKSKSAAQVRSESAGREARFVEAERNGDLDKADSIAAEGLPESLLREAPDLEPPFEFQDRPDELDEPI